MKKIMALFTQVNSDWLATSGKAQILNKPKLSTVAISGSYNDLLNKPAIPVQVQADWNATSGPSMILNKPNVVSTTQVQTDWNATAGLGVILNKPSLSAVGKTGLYSDLLNKPTLSTVATTGSYNDLTNKPTIPTLPTLATVATSGSYNDLTNKPNIPAAQVNADWNATSGPSMILNKPNVVSTTQVQTDWNATTGMGVLLNKPNFSPVATSGDYSDLKNKPTIPTLPTLATVATTGSYNDLTNKPNIPAAQIQADWNATAGLGVILNKPTTISGFGITDAVSTSMLTSSVNSIVTTAIAGLSIPSSLVKQNRKIASYTLVLTDRDSQIDMNSTTATTVTVPSNASVAFPIGSQIIISRYGTGEVSIVAASGVTIRSGGGKLRLNQQYSITTLIKIGIDEWYFAGDIKI